MTFRDELRQSLAQHTPLPLQIAEPMREAIINDVTDKVAKDLAPRLVEFIKDGSTTMLTEMAQALIEEIDNGASARTLRQVLVTFKDQAPTALDALLKEDR